MLRVSSILFALALLPGAAPAAESAPPAPSAPTGAELAACRTAADQPICLLKLAARAFAHQPYDANIEIGYAPKVLAVIGPEPAPRPMIRSAIERMALPRRAAVQALIADHAGAPPTEALAPIRAIAADKAPDPADQPRLDAEAARQRVRAYQALWSAGHGDAPLPPGHRPSDRLTRAALDAWALELPLAGDEGYPADLAAALRAFGDPQAAARIVLPAPATASGVDRFSALIDAGKFDDAARDLAALSSPPTPEHRVEALFARTLLVQKAVAGGRQDIALQIARAQLDAWFAEMADPSRPGSAHSGADIASDLLLIVQFAPRAEALKWTERMDAAARQAPPLPAAASAFAAAHAWLRLGEDARAKAVMGLWPAPSKSDVSACIVGLLQISAQCQKSPGTVLAVMLASTPPDATWEELAPITGPMALAQRTARRGLAGVDADMAQATTPERRFRILQACARGGDETPVATLAECARRLAVAPAPVLDAPLSVGTLSYDQRRLNGALNAARQAAKASDLKTVREMLDLSFDLAARAPGEQVDSIRYLEDIAIAQLRAQGRL